MRVTYVKSGAPGYGPDLTPDDIGVPADDIRAVCDVIRAELDLQADYLVDSAGNMADAELWEDAYRARCKVDDLDVIRHNLDWETRQNAPVYRDNPDALDRTLRQIIADTFPLDIDDHARLYVFDAEEEEDDDA